MTGPAELAEVIQRRGVLPGLHQFLNRDFFPEISGFPPVVAQGGDDTPVGGHEALFNPFRVARVTLRPAAASVGITKIRGILYHPPVGPGFIHRKGVSSVTVRAAHHAPGVGLSGRLLMAGQAHVHPPGGEDIDFKGPFSGMFMPEEYQQEKEAEEKQDFFHRRSPQRVSTP